MTLPDYSMRQLLEAGVHFGHQTHRWNPKMAEYIFGDRNNIHIIDLAQTVPMLHQALKAVSDTVANGGRILFVGTKRQASDIVADAARRSAQYYVNARWLGGMLTNWKTISNSIQRLKTLEEMLDSGVQGLTKKELLSLTRERDKLERALGGIKDMGGVPNMLFVIDTNKEAIAINEAQRLNIPVAAVLDTNCDPEGVTYPIPGNDDAGRAIALYCDLVARAALDGISRSQGELGVDIGASEEVPMEQPLENTAALVAESAEEVAKEVEEVKEEPAAPVEEPAAAEAAPAAEKQEETAGGDAAAPLFTAPVGEPDDLKKISGVGPVLEGKLHALGITTFAQIAAFSSEDIAKVDDALSFKGRIERDDWISQAKGFAEEA
jgi:small subunit ribosomal protein S2